MIEYDDIQDGNDTLLGLPAKSILSISSSSTDSDSESGSPPRVIKREHDVISDLNEDEVQATKAQKTSKHSGHPKAADYEVAAREVILSAVNIYHSLLATQGGFPMSSEELEFIKRSWKRAHDEIEMNTMALTPYIVRIVSFSFRVRVFFIALTFI